MRGAGGPSRADPLIKGDDHAQRALDALCPAAGGSISGGVPASGRRAGRHRPVGRPDAGPHHRRGDPVHQPRDRGLEGRPGGPADPQAADQGADRGPEADAQGLREGSLLAGHARPDGRVRLRHRRAVEEGHRRGRDHGGGDRGLELPRHHQAGRPVRQGPGPAEPADQHDLPGGQAAQEVPARHGQAGQLRVLLGLGRRADAGRDLGSPDGALREDRDLGDARGHPGHRRRGLPGRAAGDDEGAGVHRRPSRGQHDLDQRRQRRVQLQPRRGAGHRAGPRRAGGRGGRHPGAGGHG